jgi:alpha-L-fucosidase
VSKGGNFLLNVGPTSEGLIPAASVERLKEMGEWLKINGNAIYGIKQLKNYKEGDNIRYTLSPDGRSVNALLFALPEKEVIIKQIKPVEGSAIKMYGLDTDLKWKWDEMTGLTIELPDRAILPCKYVWVLKIEGAEI